MAGMLGLIAGVAREVAPVRARLAERARALPGGVHLSEGTLAGRKAALAWAGIGADRARAAARALVEAASPAEILAVGFAGGLDPALEPGTLVLAEEVFLAPAEWTARRPLLVEALAGFSRRRPDAALLARAREAAGRRGLPVRVGGLLTAGRPLARPEEKAAAGAGGLVAVEMESFAVAEAAAEAQVPFLAVRVVSEGAAEDLSGWIGLLAEDGRVRAARAAGRLLLRPWTLPEARRLARRTARAAEALAGFLEAFAAVPA